jgi:hypothetical protein
MQELTDWTLFQTFKLFELLTLFEPCKTGDLPGPLYALGVVNTV